MGKINEDLNFLQCHGQCHFEIVAFLENQTNKVFPEKTNYQPQCCIPGDESCKPGFLNILPDAPVQTKVFTIDGDPIESDDNKFSNLIQKQKNIINKATKKQSLKLTKGKTTGSDIDIPKQDDLKNLLNTEVTTQSVETGIILKENGIWRIILANCGDQPFRIAGEVDLDSPMKNIDLRLTGLLPSHTIALIVLSAFFAVWYYKVDQKLPTIPLNHQILLFAVLFTIIDSLFEIFMYLISRYLGSASILLQLLSALSKGCAISLTFYVTIVALQYPTEVSYLWITLPLAPLCLISYLQINGFTHISQRSSGTWLFGYGPAPFLLFISILILGILITVYAIRNPSIEASDSWADKKFLLRVVITLVCYLVLNFGIGFYRINKTNSQTQSIECFCYMITTLFLIAMLGLNAWFWKDYNPQGWVPMGIEQSEGGGLLSDSQIDSEDVIPPLVKETNDLDFTDELSMSGEELEIESKID